MNMEQCTCISVTSVNFKNACNFCALNHKCVPNHTLFEKAINNNVTKL